LSARGLWHRCLGHLSACPQDKGASRPCKNLFKHGYKEGETDAEGVIDPDAPLHKVEGVAQLVSWAGGGAGGGTIARRYTLSSLQETCAACGWSFALNFSYHGGVPVEHPLCPSCGGELGWRYTIQERGWSPEALSEVQAGVVVDEEGFPADRSPRAMAQVARLDAHLGGPLWVQNVRGVVDVELRPYVGRSPTEDGVKLIANVGAARTSVSLLELLGWLNQRLPVGRVSAHASAYGAPPGAVELLPFGADAGIFFQMELPAARFDSDEGQAQVAQAMAVAAELATQLRQVSLTAPARARLAVRGEGGWGERELEEVQGALLAQIFPAEPEPEEVQARIEGILAALGVEARWREGRLWFRLDSARVAVTTAAREGRLLVHLQSVLLEGIEASALPGGASLPHRVLATLNDQLRAGRCLLEPDPRAPADAPRLRLCLEKTLLATDLDPGELALTLLDLAEEADRMDNLLQEAFGGLRADQGGADADAVDLAPLAQRVATRGLPDVARKGVEAVLAELHAMLDALQLLAHEDEAGGLWFRYGSARLRLRAWSDGRATRLTLRARVLHEVARTDGLPEALNAINQQIHFGAFTLQEGRHVELTETIFADELSLEELTYALLTLGELADTHDNPLQALFGGQLAEEL
jgi:hypothetical protein